jgi:hypothetical protein
MGNSAEPTTSDVCHGSNLCSILADVPVLTGACGGVCLEVIAGEEPPTMPPGKVEELERA